MLSSIKDYDRIGATFAETEDGIHLIRSYLAHLRARKRRERLGYYTEAAMKFDRLGVVCCLDYFPEHLADQLRTEIKTYPLGVSKNIDNTLLHRSNTKLHGLLEGDQENNLYRLLLDCLGYMYDTPPAIEALKLYRQNTFVQRLRNMKNDGDVQKVFHQDTFFPALKFWWFPDEVTIEEGPFEYSIGSHLFTLERAKYIQDESLRISAGYVPEFSKDHGEGSLRIAEENLEKYGFNKPAKQCVPKNTLVIANVFGFHRRSEVEAEGFRDALHGSIRIDFPFS